MSEPTFPDYPGDTETDALEVLIANQQSSLKVDEEALVQVARNILLDSDFRQGELSVAIVDDETIHELNRQYLNHDYATDVLSFLLEEDNFRIVGEIILSADTASREAAQVGWSPQTEMLLYVIHGVLHLVGYDDLDDNSRKEMRQREREYLIGAGVDAEVIDSRLPDATNSTTDSEGDLPKKQSNLEAGE